MGNNHATTPVKYTRQQFLAMEDALDEKFFVRNGGRLTKEEIITKLRECGVGKPEVENVCVSLYNDGKIVHMLDNIIFHTHRDKGAVLVYNNKEYSLSSMDYMKFSRMLHSRKHQNQVLHIIMRHPKSNFAK